MLLALILLLGGAVRLYPVLHPYVGPDTQEAYPLAAIIAVAQGHWQPHWSVHGPGFFDTLRVLFSAWYGLGRMTGLYRDRLDLLASFVADPLPFIVCGRLVVVAFALLGLGLVARLGSALHSADVGLAAAALLAVTFIHVRESHQVWPDVPAASMVLAAVAASLTTLRRSSPRWAMAAGALGGLAIATKLSAFPVLLPVALGAVCGDGSLRARIGRAAGAALVATLAYLLASPYSVLAFQTAWVFASRQYDLTFGPAMGALPLGRIVDLGCGFPLVAVAGAGVLVAARRWPLRESLVVGAFPIAYIVVLLASNRLFVRYLALLAPFVALFAALAVVAATTRWLPRHGGWATTLLVLALAARPAMLSIEFDRFLARDDTRTLGGAWLAEHAGAGARVTIPDASGYMNPTLPPTDLVLQTFYPNEAWQLRPLLGRALRDWVVDYPAAPNRIPRGVTSPDRFVVTATHPIVAWVHSTPPGAVEALRRSGGRVVAEFVGTPIPLPPEVSYDPIDADYVPLRGWDALMRPGPNLTIWQLPPAPG